MARSREPRWLKDVRVRAVAAVLLAAVALVAIAWSFPADALSPTPNAGDARLQPSGEGLPFDPGRYRDFDDYLRQTRDRLERHKVYVDPRRKETELAAATPFELPPADGCAPAQSARPRRGILLLHGLADMPLAMRDLAGAFAARCFLVRVMLLPGHGARAGDLLTVTRGDWLAAARFGVKTLKQDSGAVFVGGFSLGGLLSIHALLEDDAVNGAFVFSPALALERAWLVRQAVWLRHFLKWLDRDPPDDYARYEAMPVNATAETYLLTRGLGRLLERRPRPGARLHGAQRRRPPSSTRPPPGAISRTVSPIPGAACSCTVATRRRGADPGRWADQLLQQLSAPATDRRLLPSLAPHRARQRALRPRGRLPELRPEFRRERRGRWPAAWRPRTLGGGRCSAPARRGFPRENP